MAQAIITKFLGATNTKGARIKAHTGLGNTASSVTTGYHSLEAHLSEEERHREVAQALVNKMNAESDGHALAAWVVQSHHGLSLPTQEGYAFGMERVWL